MALAIRFEQLIRDGTVHDQANLARLAHISRARVRQIMDLLLLAPEIQEEMLFMPAIKHGNDTYSERIMRQITAQQAWKKQLETWQGFISQPRSA